MTFEYRSQPAPPWFEEALATPYEERSVTVAGCPIHFQFWGERDRDAPGILLVHGNGAHAHWWDFIAPALSKRLNVAAPDLSGMGDSGHREEYSVQLFAEEILAVAGEAGFGDRVILAGHSFGGTVCRVAAALRPRSIAALVLLDSVLTPRRAGSGSGRRSPRVGARNAGRARPPRLYPSREEACRRFRLRPPQPCDNRYILDHIARHSVRETERGWCWKADHRVFAKMVNRGRFPAHVGEHDDFPVGMIYGERSRFFPPEAVAALAGQFPTANMVALEDAHHHLFLDQPQRFAEALLDLLDRWRVV